MKFCIVGVALLRIMAVFCGAAGLLLYENEERKLDDRINSWWIRLDDLGKNAKSRTSLFISRSAGLTSSFFDQLLGPNLFSARTAFIGLGSSLCLAYASLIFFGRLGPYIPYIAKSYTRPIPTDMFSLVHGAAWIVFSMLPAYFKNRYWLAGWLGFIGWNILWPMFDFGRIVQHAWGGHFFERYIFAMFVCVALSAVADFLFVGLNRVILRRIKNDHKTFANIVSLLMGNIVVAVLIVAAPFGAGIFLASHFDKSSQQFLLPLTGPLLISSILNCIDIACASLFFLIALFLLMYHYLFWPLISRPMYGLATIGIGKRRAQLWGAALLLWNNHFAIDLLCKWRF